MEIYLLTVQYRDSTDGVLKYVYFGSMGYITRPSDTPASTIFHGCLSVPFMFTRQCYKDGVRGGSGLASFGACEILNSEGEFDFLRKHGLDGYQITLQRGEHNARISTFTTVFTGIQGAPEFSFDTITLRLRGNVALLSKQLQSQVYLGGNASSFGIEGDDQLKDKAKPFCIGRCYNISPDLVNSQKVIYRVHSGAIQSIDAVYSNGASCPLDTSVGTSGDCATVMALMSATVTSGKYATCLAEGLFRLGSISAIDTEITADVCGDKTGGTYVNTCADAVKRVLDICVPTYKDNQFLQSEDFTDTSVWGTAMLGATTLPNSTLSPDGFLTADSFKEDSSSALRERNQTRTKSATSQLAVVMCRAKLVSGTRGVVIEVGDSTLTNKVAATFNLVGVTVGNALTATGTGWEGWNAAIFPLGDGWYVCVIICKTDATTSIRTRIGLATNATSTFAAYTGDGTSEVALWGAQLTYGTRIYEYIKTTTTVQSATENAVSINTARFTALNTANSAEIGVFVGSNAKKKIIDFCTDLLQSIGACIYDTRLGLISVGRLARPGVSDTPVLSIIKNIILEGVDLLVPFDDGDGIPVSKVVLSYQVNNTVQDDKTIAGNVTADRKAFLVRETRDVMAESGQVKVLHPLATTLSIDTYLVSKADALAEASRLLVLYKDVVIRIKCSISLDEYVDSSGNPLSIEMCDIIFLILDRFDLDLGKKLVVISCVEDYTERKVALEVWG